MHLSLVEPGDYRVTFAGNGMLRCHLLRNTRINAQIVNVIGEMRAGLWTFEWLVVIVVISGSIF